MLVKDIMTWPAITVSVEAPLVEALDLLIDHKLSGLPVVDGCGSICGVLTEGDLIRRMELGTAMTPAKWWERLFTVDSAEAYRLANGRTVVEVMTSTPITIESKDPLAAVVDLMEKHQINRLPVINGGEIVGVISRADIVRALRRFVTTPYEEQATSDHEIKERITAEIAIQPWSSACMLQISVKDGMVGLHGSVPADNQRRAAVVAAENVVGVRSVTEDIQIVDGTLISDGAASIIM